MQLELNNEERLALQALLDTVDYYSDTGLTFHQEKLLIGLAERLKLETAATVVDRRSTLPAGVAPPQPPDVWFTAMVRVINRWGIECGTRMVGMPFGDEVTDFLRNCWCEELHKAISTDLGGHVEPVFTMDGGALVTGFKPKTEMGRQFIEECHRRFK